MEMHQVRYFLAVARTLNFTRAAEECNVAQPSLTRAIKQLEHELGGELLHRERPHAQLTELGRQMVPLLQQCYESALGARDAASAIKKGAAATLRFAVSETVNPSLFAPHIAELARSFSGLEVAVVRGAGAEIEELLRAGEVELGVSAADCANWDRLDRWPLFDERFELAISNCHPLADQETITLNDLRDRRFVLRSYCESGPQLVKVMIDHGIDMTTANYVAGECALTLLVEAGLGVGLMPESAAEVATVLRKPVNDLDFRRTVSLFAVAGRQRTQVGSAMVKLLRSYAWQARPASARLGASR
jgi:DNA-binding transcriptional LysR family regulator